MNTLQIDCFLMAAKYKSFSLAASKMFVSQPTLSRNISMLEKELGLVLFYRNSFHGIDLTESGQIMLDAFSHMKKNLDSAIETAQNIERNKQISITLGLLEGQLLDEKTTNLISAFKQEHPNAEFKILRDDYKGLMSRIESDDISFICMPRWQFQNAGDLSLQDIAEMETVMVVPKCFQAEFEDREYSLRELEKYPFLSVDEHESYAALEMMENLCRELGMDITIRRLPSLQEEIQKVEMGEGIIAINTYNSVCYSPNVNCVRIREFEPQTFTLAWKSSSTSESVTCFKLFLSNYCNIHK